MKILKHLKAMLIVLIVALLVPAFSSNVFAQQKDGNKQKTEQTTTKKSKHKKHRKHHKKHKKSKKNKSDNQNNNKDNKK